MSLITKIEDLRRSCLGSCLLTNVLVVLLYQTGLQSVFEFFGFASTRAITTGGFFLSSISLIKSWCFVCVRVSTFVYQKNLNF